MRYLETFESIKRRKVTSNPLAPKNNIERSGPSQLKITSYDFSEEKQNDNFDEVFNYLKENPDFNDLVTNRKLGLLNKLEKDVKDKFGKESLRTLYDILDREFNS